MSYPTKFGEGTESPAELALALAMDAAGLTYEKQKEFSQGTWRRRVDFWFPAAEVAVEVDGYSYHSSEEAFEKDRRNDWLMLYTWGVPVIRYSAREVFADPIRVARTVRTFVERAFDRRYRNDVGERLSYLRLYGKPIQSASMTGGLACPACCDSGSYLHIVRTTERKGGSDGTRSTVDITYECELCGRLSTMTHTNHKGSACVAWSNVGAVSLTKWKDR